MCAPFRNSAPKISTRAPRSPETARTRVVGAARRRAEEEALRRADGFYWIRFVRFGGVEVGIGRKEGKEPPGQQAVCGTEGRKRSTPQQLPTLPTYAYIHQQTWFSAAGSKREEIMEFISACFITHKCAVGQLQLS